MTTIPVIVQARMTSSRLPGKVMMPFAGKTFLEHTLDRCARIRGISEVICAVPDSPASDPIVARCKARGYRVHRGSEQDVLARYLGAARAVRADAVIRITSDCPVTDPAISEAVLQRFLKGDGDLVTTNIPASWPLGMDSEIVTMAALEDAARESRITSDREHVTTFIRRRPGRYHQINLPCPQEGRAHWRLTLDTAADRQFFLALAEGFDGGFEALALADWPTLCAYLDANPALCALNTDETFAETP